MKITRLLLFFDLSRFGDVMEQKTVYKLIRPLVIIIYVILGAIAFKLFMEHVFKWVLPFIIGFFLSRLALPLSEFMKKKLKTGRRFSCIASSVIVLLACVLAIGFLVFFIYIQLLPFFAGLTDMYSDFAGQLNTTWDKILAFVEKLPPSVADSVKNAINALPEKIDFVNLLIMPVLNAAGSLPTVIFSFIATIVSTFFFVIDNERIRDFLIKAIKPKLYEQVCRTYQHLFSSLFKWLKAQLILCSVCFAELLIGFLILGLEYAFLLALLIAMVDFLPVLGAGTVLIPWSIASLLLGNFKLAIGLAVIYVVILLVRNTLEPNVVGIQIGMHPLVTLFGIYIGFRIYGFFGMFMLPLLLITIIQLNKWRYIKLWDVDSPAHEDELLTVKTAKKK
jgi:sporulation integral membrane protein YtvI